MDGEHRALDAHRQCGIGDDDGDLQDAVGERVEARHLQVDPDQVVLAAGEVGGGGGSGGVVGHGGPRKRGILPQRRGGRRSAT